MRRLLEVLTVTAVLAATATPATADVRVIAGPFDPVQRTFDPLADIARDPGWTGCDVCVRPPRLTLAWP